MALVQAILEEAMAHAGSRTLVLTSTLVLAAGLRLAPAVAQSTPSPAPKLGGYVQVRETAQPGTGLTATLNRARFSIDGGLPARFTYRVLVELEAPSGTRTPATVSLREAILRWNPGPLAITAGQFKTPFSREYLIPVPALETADFAAVVDSLVPKYDLGVMAEVALGPFATLSTGAFNGEGQNATANRDSSVMLVTRVEVRPLAQLTLGANSTRDGPDSLRWGVEASLSERGATARAEYIARHRRSQPTGADDRGWYVLAGYRVMPAFQLIARQEDFQRPLFGAARSVRATTIGTNFEIAPGRVRLLLEGVRRSTGARSTRTDSCIAQLQVRF
jgi:hypothetical protein